MCIVTGARQYSMHLPQGGLEIPCRYIFKMNNQAESNKTTILKITIKPTSVDEPTLLEAHNPVQVVDMSTSKETPAVTTPIHEKFSTTSIDQEIQCFHCSTDPVPVVTIHEECNNEPPPKKRKLSDIDIEESLWVRNFVMLILNWSKNNLRHSSLNWVAYILLCSTKRGTST